MNLLMILISLLFLCSLSIMVIFTKKTMEINCEENRKITKYEIMENLIIIGILVITTIIYAITNAYIHINSEYNSYFNKILVALLVICLLISLLFSVISLKKNGNTNGFINKILESKVLIILVFPFNLYFTVTTIKNIFINLNNYSNNYKYLRNKSIIQGIRNSISHGSYRVILNGNISKTLVIFYIAYIFIMVCLIFLNALNSKKAKSQFFIMALNLIIHIIILIILGI